MMLSQRVSQKAQVLAKRAFGNFEQFHPIPPRYFLVKYQLNQREFREKILDAPTAELAIEHRENVQKAVESQKIVFRGELMPEREALNAEDGQEAVGVAQTSDLEEIIFVFNARDEREPHTFIKADPLFTNGIVRDWDIQELDITHKERDDELVLTGKF